MKKIIENQIFDEERALYGLHSGVVRLCRFEGAADGESAMKESREIEVDNCGFSLRYPLWHVDNFTLENSTMRETCRAPLWYSKSGRIEGCEISGVKAVRECRDIMIKNCRIDSTEFGWKCSGITLLDTEITSEYLFLDSKDVRLKNIKMHGKYSFQYVDGLTIEHCDLDTKDAFWHAKNVTVKNSTVKGEYLAWFSENLTLENCRIIGTQPFCYCKNLKLTGCTMEGCDLAFEYSSVSADVRGRIDSVKNPRSGAIVCDEVGEILMGNAVMDCTGEVIIRQ